MEDIVARVQAAIAERDWDSVRRLLHPYLHWTVSGGRVLRGRKNVMAMLSRGEAPATPTYVESRDGQIYHWQS